MCQSIHDQGYSIALDDFVSQPEFEPLTRIAELIKVDLRTTSKEEQERLLRTYKPRGITMLAEKVETHEEFEWARKAGYDLFQGYFFARPVIVSGRQIPAVKATCLRLLRESQQTELDFPAPRGPDSRRRIAHVQIAALRELRALLQARENQLDRQGSDGARRRWGPPLGRSGNAADAGDVQAGRVDHAVHRAGSFL